MPGDMTRRYRLEYDPGNGQITEWLKTLDELLVPNGEDCLLVWMLKQAEERNLAFTLTAVESDGEWMQDVRP